MSFQATEWARGLPLPTIRLKFTLMMIGSYAGTDGVAFPSLTTLAEDTLQSPQTVRRRIRELEELGLLVRYSRWTTPDHKVVLTRQSDDRPPGCRQSSDELRLQLKMTSEQLLAAIAQAGISAENEPSDQDDETPVEEEGEGISVIPSPPVTALTGGGYPSSDRGRVSPESYPLNLPSKASGEAPPFNPPASGEASGFDPELRKTGRKRLNEIMPIWPEPITNVERAIVVLGALTAEEWGDCLLGAKGFAAFIQGRKAAGKERIIKDFHNWARNRQWVGFLGKGADVEAGARRLKVEIDSREGVAWRAIHEIARITLLEFNGCYSLPGPLPPQLVAFADAPKEAEWLFIPEAEKLQVGAWRGFLNKTLDGKVRPELVNDRNWRGSQRISERGFMAPWPWPPGVDGKIYATGPPEAEVA